MTQRCHLLELPAKVREVINDQVYFANNEQPSSPGRLDTADMILQPGDIYSGWIGLLQGAVYVMHPGEFQQWRGILRLNWQLQHEAVTRPLGKPVLLPGALGTLRTSIEQLDSLAKDLRTLWITDLSDWDDAGAHHGRCASSKNVIARATFDTLMPLLRDLPSLDTIILDTAALLNLTNIHRCLKLLRDGAKPVSGAGHDSDVLECFAAIVRCAASSNTDEQVQLPATVICANFFEPDRRWTPTTLPADSSSEDWNTVLYSMLVEGCIILSNKSAPRELEQLD